jgi:hypothetical protein
MVWYRVRSPRTRVGRIPIQPTQSSYVGIPHLNSLQMHMAQDNSLVLVSRLRRTIRARYK